MKKLLMIAVLAMGFVQLSEAGGNGGGVQNAASRAYASARAKCSAQGKTVGGSFQSGYYCVTNGLLGAVPGRNGGGIQRLPGSNPATYGCPSGYHKLANGSCMRNGGLL